MSTTRELLDACRARGIRIAVAESCTGGLVAAELTRIPGSSDVFAQGFVTYSNSAKRRALRVSAESLERHGAVSAEVAAEMAEGACAGSGADLSVAVTGVAGPGGSESKPEGRVCFALAFRGRVERAETEEFGARGRDEVRRASVRRAIGLLLGFVQALNS